MSKTGYIYKLVCNDIEVKECYVGSTRNFRHRKYGHKTSCNNSKCKEYNYYVYQFIRENGNFENWDMVQIEEFKHDTKRELHGRERHWLETLGATLNKQKPTRTKTEWYEEHKEHLSEKAKEWREDNKEVLSQKAKEYYEANKEKAEEYRKRNKEVIAEKMKEYRQRQKEEIAKKMKEYREKNKEVILEQRKEYRQKAKIKTTCACGSTFNKEMKSRHEKSQKHKDYITSVPHTVS
jgi:hypothetical protein